MSCHGPVILMTTPSHQTLQGASCDVASVPVVRFAL